VALPVGPSFNPKNLVSPVFQKGNFRYPLTGSTIFTSNFISFKAFFKSRPPASNAQTYNFHAMIVIDDGGYCSGALIEPDKILTTAQCIKGYDLI
jgi:hypothetical protein